jgi:hypothetical protein
MDDLRPVDVRDLCRVIPEKGTTMQKYMQSRFAICEDEDFLVQKNADGSYEMVSPAVGADGSGLRTDVIATMSALQLVKLGRQIQDATEGMVTDLVRQREDLERTLDYLGHSENSHGRSPQP